MKKRGQLEISFGMIFSIVLIIAFLGFGFYAITKFIDFQNTIKIQKFLSDFQNDVSNMWKSPQGSTNLAYELPTYISSVCFVNDEYANLIFTAKDIIPGKEIDYLNIKNITSVENPYCIQNVKGAVHITILKDFREQLVRVERT